MAFMGIFILSIVMFVMFGPRNPFIAFAFGASVVLVLAALAFRFPVLQSFSSVRERSEMKATATLASKLAKAAIDNSSDPRANSLKFARMMGWLWTIIVGGLALLMGLGILWMVMQGDEPAKMTDAALLLGYFSATAAVTWKYLARIGPK